MRTSRDVLPTRYRSRTIHLRRVPRLPPHGFDEVHLILMRELMAAPATLDALVERTDLPARQVSQHVAALFFAGGLTTDPRQRTARRGPGAPRLAGAAAGTRRLHGRRPSSLCRPWPSVGIRRAVQPAARQRSCALAALRRRLARFCASSGCSPRDARPQCAQKLAAQSGIVLTLTCIARRSHAMRSQVTVSWSEQSSHRFDLEEVQPMPHEQARAWLDEQFTVLECEPHPSYRQGADRRQGARGGAGRWRAALSRCRAPGLGDVLCPRSERCAGQAGGAGRSGDHVGRLLTAAAFQRALSALSSLAWIPPKPPLLMQTM